MPSTLAIGELNVDCRVPRAVADDSRRARDVLDRVLSSVTQELLDYLDRVLAAEPESDTIAFIENLHFEVAISTQWPRDQIARALAVQLSRSLWRTLEEPNTIQFKDRAELLARFVLDLAQGTAYARGWHSCFDGLRLLPRSAILRTLIVDEPAIATIALTRLLAADLDNAAALLSESDAERALGTILKAASSESELVPASIVAAMLSQYCFSLQTPQRRLALAIAISRETGRVDAAALALARLLLKLATSPDAGTLADSDCGERLDAALRALANELDEASMSRLRRLDAGSIANAVHALHRERPPAQAREQQSRCGGVWLLLPHLLIALGNEADASPLALCALAVAAGGRSQDVWNDVSLREALGLEERELLRFRQRAGPIVVAIVGEDDHSADRSIPAGTRRRNLRHLLHGAAMLELPAGFGKSVSRLASMALSAYARRLPGFADSSFGHLWDNLLATEASVRMDESVIDVILAAPPLDVIWKISGADRASYSLPNGRAVRVGARR